MLYSSEKVYIDSSTNLKEKIAKINVIIVALEDKALGSVTNMDIDEYSIDDGQSKIKTVYKDIDSIFKAISNFEKIKQMYINRLNGRIVRLVPANSVTNYN